MKGLDAAAAAAAFAGENVPKASAGSVDVERETAAEVEEAEETGKEEYEGIPSVGDKKRPDWRTESNEVPIETKRLNSFT